MDLQQALHVAFDHERRIRDHYASSVPLIGSDQRKEQELGVWFDVPEFSLETE